MKKKLLKTADNVPGFHGCSSFDPGILAGVHLWFNTHNAVRQAWSSPIFHKPGKQVWRGDMLMATQALAEACGLVPKGGGFYGSH